MSGETLKFRSLYKALVEKLKFLKKYLDEMLEKGQIRKSKSLASSPIIFVLKSDGKGGWTKRLCIDFRKLNSITVKNRYLILNIQELRDKLHGVKWLTKLDQRVDFNLIRMKAGEE